MVEFERKAVDIDSYVNRTRQGSCFICELIAGNPEFRHHIVYESETEIAFLDRYPTIRAHVLIAPKRHLEHVTYDFSLEEYLHFQTLIYQISEAVSKVEPTERMYIYTLGSQQGNSHVHWHLAPLPPGVPYEQQQFHALMLENGVLHIPENEMKELAERIAEALQCLRRS